MSAVLEPIHRLTVDDVFKMVEAGVLTGEDRVELVDGILTDIVPPGGQHSGTVAWLNEHFTRAAGTEWEVRVQDALFVPAGFLSPDLMLVPREAARTERAVAMLVVEVSYTSRRRDEDKVPLYAAAGVPEYWRVDIETAEVVVRREPTADGYADLRRFGPGETIAPPVAAPPVDVAALLGR
jgi:Uma2 family endonuclease